MLAAEAAKVLDVTPATVRDMARRGDTARRNARRPVSACSTEADVKRLAKARAARARRSRRLSNAPPSPWLTADSTPRSYLHRGRRFVRREIHAGRLRAVQVGGRKEILTRAEWLDAWVRDQEDVEPMPYHGPAAVSELTENGARPRRNGRAPQRHVPGGGTRDKVAYRLDHQSQQASLTCGPRSRTCVGSWKAILSRVSNR